MQRQGFFFFVPSTVVQIKSQSSWKKYNSTFVESGERSAYVNSLKRAQFKAMLFFVMVAAVFWRRQGGDPYCVSSPRIPLCRCCKFKWRHCIALPILPSFALHFPVLNCVGKLCTYFSWPGSNEIVYQLLKNENSGATKAASDPIYELSSLDGSWGCWWK